MILLMLLKFCKRNSSFSLNLKCQIKLKSLETQLNFLQRAINSGKKTSINCFLTEILIPPLVQLRFGKTN
jgi:hypothetical protein